MKLAIMQPYFFPYIGYFQLISAVDLFIVYDNIKYTKKGWITRNRILQNGKDALFSLSLKGDSDHLNICDRTLSVDFDRDKLLGRVHGAYRRAPHFVQTFPLVEAVMQCGDTNLFRFLHQSIIEMCGHLGIETDIRVSSDIAIDHNLKNQDKVLALSAKVGANTYVNSIGGTELYDKEYFADKGIELAFLRPAYFEYSQFGNVFVPWLSIIDVLMFNSLDAVRTHVTKGYELV